MFGGMRKLKIGVRVETRDNNHIKVKGILKQYVCSGSDILLAEGSEGHVWLIMDILTKDEKQFHHDVEVMKLLGIDIRG